MMLTALLGTSFHSGFFLGLFSTLKIQATCSCKSVTDFQQTTLHHIPEERTLCEVNASAPGQYSTLIT
jgi:hypothetical protein